MEKHKHIIYFFYIFTFLSLFLPYETERKLIKKDNKILPNILVMDTSISSLAKTKAGVVALETMAGCRLFSGVYKQNTMLVPLTSIMKDNVIRVWFISIPVIRLISGNKNALGYTRWRQDKTSAVSLIANTKTSLDISSLVAHELAHALNVVHNGNYLMNRAPTDTWRLSTKTKRELGCIK